MTDASVPVPAFTPRAVPSEASRWAKTRYLVRIYWRLIGLQLRTFVEYRGDFWIGMVGAALLQGSSLVFIGALFSRLPSVGGWTLWEVALLYGFTLIAYGTREVLCDGPWTLRATINKGEFDRLLVRPLSPALQTATLIASIHGIANAALGWIVLLVAAHRVGLAWTPWTVLWTLVTVVCGTVIVSCVAYLANIIGFWEPGTSSAFPFMIANLVELVKFPLELYGWLIRVGVTVVLPFAFISYYPVLVLLDKDSPVRWLGYLTPLVTAMFVGVTAWSWRKSVNRYQGVGH
jgi:ABC-2 type transport system permease protein